MMNTIYKIICLGFILFLTQLARAETTKINDYGAFLSPSKFKVHCILHDINISGNETFELYNNGQITCQEFHKIYKHVYAPIQSFLRLKGYIIDNNAPKKNLTIRILSLADLNNPKNFSNTDARCMYHINCVSGPYFGRTFFSRYYDNINVYIVYNNVIGYDSDYSFISTLKHELIHVILYRYGWHYSLDESEEENLISEFLIWDRNHK